MHHGKSSFLSFKQRPGLRREADWFTASCVAKTIRRPGEEEHKTSLEMNLLNTLQNNWVWGVCVCYCDGRRIRVWLILPGVRCGVGEGRRGSESVHRCRGRGEGSGSLPNPAWSHCGAGLFGVRVCVSARVRVELGAWGGDYTVTLFTLFMHTRPLWVPLCRISVYLNLFWENSTWLGRGSL